MLVKIYEPKKYNKHLEYTSESKSRNELKNPDNYIKHLYKTQDYKNYEQTINNLKGESYVNTDNDKNLILSRNQQFGFNKNFANNTINYNICGKLYNNCR